MSSIQLYTGGGMEGLAIHIVPRNDGTQGILVWTESGTIEGDNLPNNNLNFEVVFPDSVVNPSITDHNNIPNIYQSEVDRLFGTLDPGQTEEGTLCLPYVNNGEKATSIRLEHGIGPDNDLSSAVTNDFDWKIPQTLEPAVSPVP